jgi:hypothetical protein
MLLHIHSEKNPTNHHRAKHIDIDTIGSDKKFRMEVSI